MLRFLMQLLGLTKRPKTVNPNQMFQLYLSNLNAKKVVKKRE